MSDVFFPLGKNKKARQNTGPFIFLPILSKHRASIAPIFKPLTDGIDLSQVADGVKLPQLPSGRGLNIGNNLHADNFIRIGDGTVRTITFFDIVNIFHPGSNFPPYCILTVQPVTVAKTNKELTIG